MAAEAPTAMSSRGESWAGVGEALCGEQHGGANGIMGPSSETLQGDPSPAPGIFQAHWPEPGFPLQNVFGLNIPSLALGIPRPYWFRARSHAVSGPSIWTRLTSCPGSAAVSGVQDRSLHPPSFFSLPLLSSAGLSAASKQRRKGFP